MLMLMLKRGTKGICSNNFPKENTVKAHHSLLKNKSGVAWVLMISAISIHVFDEAVTNFLPFYNGLALKMRESLGFSLLPNFSFEAWLGGLIAGIIICFSLTPLVHRGGRFIRTFATLLGMLMVVNALGHMVGSAYVGRLLPGFWSSPFLLLTALLVVILEFRGTSPAANRK
jgi:hypothetical protein